MRISIIVLLLLAPIAAHAQVVFPADSEYRPLYCGNAVMTDGFADSTANVDERDVVGDGAAPAGLRASDATHLYLRIRLDDDPVTGNMLRPSSWGMQYDLDDDATDYELLILVDGMAPAQTALSVFRNTTTTATNDPGDPADQPAARSYAFATNVRSAPAGGSQFGGNADVFLDFAVPWADLVPLGLDRDTPTRVWVASSTSQNSLDGDFACHGGAGGAPTLSGTASDPTTGDPNNPGAGGGTGRLEGGGGCAAGGHAGVLLLLALLGLRRRRGRP
jgi:hypothetical protein